MKGPWHQESSRLLTNSHVQIIRPHLCPNLRLHLPTRTLLSPPIIRHLPHQRRRILHGVRYNIRQYTWHRHGLFRIRTRRSSMGTDGNTHETPEYGHVESVCNHLLACAVDGFGIGACEPRGGGMGECVWVRALGWIVAGDGDGFGYCLSGRAGFCHGGE